MISYGKVQHDRNWDVWSFAMRDNAKCSDFHAARLFATDRLCPRHQAIFGWYTILKTGDIRSSLVCRDPQQLKIPLHAFVLPLITTLARNLHG